MPSKTPTCRELVELVTDYLEGMLRPAERAQFEAHIEECKGCSIYLDQMRATIKLTGKLTTQSLSRTARHELLTLFRDWRPQRASQ
jgi:anti-sigma factor RsiW